MAESGPPKILSSIKENCQNCKNQLLQNLENNQRLAASQGVSIQEKQLNLN